MKRLLIADDEPRQRRGLKSLISEFRPELIILEAANGYEALQIAKREKIDAILTDIRMPMVDGFELSEKLRESNPTVVIAYVSAYEDFNYAARALHIGAVEYLLKPYTREQVEATIEALERNVLKQQVLLKTHRQLDNTMDAWRDQKLTALLTRPLTAEERTDLEEILPLYRSGCVLRVQILNIDPDDWSIEESIETQEQLKNWITGILPDMILFAMSQDSLSLAGIYTGSLTPEELESRLDTFLHEMIKGFPIQVFIALSEGIPNLSTGAKRAFDHVLYTAGFHIYMPQGGILAHPSIKHLHGHELPYLFRFEQLLQQKLQKPTEDGIDDIIDEMFAYIDAPMHYSPDKLVRRLYQVAQSMVGCIENRLPKETFSRLWADTAAVFSDLTSYSQLCENFHQLMHSIVLAQAQEHHEHTEECIQSCIDYIRLHYGDPLSLSELGERFYFSPNYLSALIKSRTGVPFKQFLQTLRMNAAETLLKDSEGKVSDIARTVGFPDPAYFNRIFKKQYGVSPDTFRRKIKSRSVGRQTS